MISARPALGIQVKVEGVEFYLPGMSLTDGQAVTAALLRPEGTFEIKGTYPRLLDPAAGPGRLAWAVTGAMVFILERDTDGYLNFVHSVFQINDEFCGSPDAVEQLVRTWTKSGPAA